MGHERYTFVTGKGYFHFAPTLYTVGEPVNSQTLVSQANRNNMGGAGGSLVGKKMEELLIVKFFFTFFFFLLLLGSHLLARIVLLVTLEPLGLMC